MHNNTCELIPSVSNWIFIDTCTSTTPSPPLAALWDARTRSTFIRQPGFFLPHHCWGLAQEHGASGIHRLSETVPLLFIVSRSIKVWDCARLCEPIFPDFMPAWGHFSERGTKLPPLQKTLPRSSQTSLCSVNSDSGWWTVFYAAQYLLLPAVCRSVYIDLYIFQPQQRSSTVALFLPTQKTALLGCPV